MALVLKDRVQETTTTAGQGTITLAGAVSGFQTFAAIGNGNTTYYTIAGTTQWEMGIGTYTASGTTLSRDTVISNSLGDTTKIDFAAGTKNVFCTYPAEQSLYVDGSNITPGTAATLPIISGGTGSSTATFSGANITSLNASNISSGTLANARTTAASANGANTIVTRDASGAFSAGIITADGSALTSLNASNISSGTLGVANGGTGANTLALNNVILGNTTSAVKLVAPGTSGNVLTSDGTIWASTAPAASGFDAGTRMIFAQNTAPTGWTKDTTNYNEHAIRLVTGTAGGTGGTVNFTTAFASQAVSGTVGTSGATTLTTPQIPSHSHSISAYYGPSNDSAVLGPGNNNYQSFPAATGNAGGGGSHTHSGGTFTGTAIDLAVKYLNCITATKN